MMLILDCKEFHTGVCFNNNICVAVGHHSLNHLIDKGLGYIKEYIQDQRWAIIKTYKDAP